MMQNVHTQENKEQLMTYAETLVDNLKPVYDGNAHREIKAVITSVLNCAWAVCALLSLVPMHDEAIPEWVWWAIPDVRFNKTKIKAESISSQAQATLAEMQTNDAWQELYTEDCEAVGTEFSYGQAFNDFASKAKGLLEQLKHIIAADHEENFG